MSYNNSRNFYNDPNQRGNTGNYNVYHNSGPTTNNTEYPDLAYVDIPGNVHRTATDFGYTGIGHPSTQFHQEGYIHGSNEQPQVYPNAAAKSGIFDAQPIMSDVAMLYGSKLMDQGKEIVDKELNKYFSLMKLKFYFSVDTNYTVKKLKLLLFPFNNKVWAPNVRGQLVYPRDDINAPDLYIPLMAYITFVLLASVVIGTQKMFSPEVLGIVASRALACVFFELVVQIITIYITNLRTEIATLDLLSFSGYKFVGVIIALLLNRLVSRLAFYIGIIYTGTSLSFFLIRSLKWRMVKETMPPYGHVAAEDISVSGIYQGKRRLYFLLWIGLSQPFLMWWLSYNLDFSHETVSS